MLAVSTGYILYCSVFYSLLLKLVFSLQFCGSLKGFCLVSIAFKAAKVVMLLDPNSRKYIFFDYVSNASSLLNISKV